MRTLIVGLNEQGLMYQNATGRECVAIARTIQEIPLNSYDAVIVCCSNENKYNIVKFALGNGKHVLLHAPLWATNLHQLDELEQLSIRNRVTLYVAYSNRCVTDFSNIYTTLRNKSLGEINHCRIAHTNCADSRQNGALIDLVPGILELLYFWFGEDITQNNFSILHKDQLGRHVILADFNSRFTIEIEANFLANRDTISIDLFGTRDDLHITYANDEAKRHILAEQEYTYFIHLCQQTLILQDLNMDKWIYSEIDRLASEELLLA